MTGSKPQVTQAIYAKKLNVSEPRLTLDVQQWRPVHTAISAASLSSRCSARAVLERYLLSPLLTVSLIYITVYYRWCTCNIVRFIFVAILADICHHWVSICIPSWTAYEFEGLRVPREGWETACSTSTSFEAKHQYTVSLKQNIMVR